jgi:hypothetical protein
MLPELKEKTILVRASDIVHVPDSFSPKLSVSNNDRNIKN